MKYIAAYLLSKAAGNEKPTTEQVKEILKAAGVEIDDALVEQVVTKLSEKPIEETIENGKAQMAKVGGGAVAATSSAPAAAAAAAVEEPVEEEAAPLDLGDMFGDF